MLDYEVLRVIWWALVGVLLIGFAITDGFDMGVGALLPIIGKNDNERRVMINTIAPHWDRQSGLVDYCWGPSLRLGLPCMPPHFQASMSPWC